MTRVKVIVDTEARFEVKMNVFLSDDTKVVKDIKVNTTQHVGYDPDYHAFIFYEEATK